jgi:pyridoxamine 5'-phosphate oxidase
VGLVENEMAPDPFTQFDEWFSGVVESGLDEPNSFVLATATRDGAPSARAVLMKGFDELGLVFYTNLQSRKSSEIKANPNAAATFVWTPLHRQVRFEGTVTQVEAGLADTYFSSRPRGSQVAAHASMQSTRIDSREELDLVFSELDAGFGDGKIPRPSWWGGWRLSPNTVEFWQGQPNRFHDRVRYTRSAGSWAMERLAP